MRQQINLYQPTTREEPALFGARTALVAVAAVIVALAAIWGYGTYKVRRLQQSAQVLKQEQAAQDKALAAASTTFDNVIKLNYYCSDAVDLAVDLPVLREIRDAFVNAAAPPASTFVVVRRLVRPGWLIEVEAVALVPDAGR